MTDKQIERKLRKAVKHTTPDIKADIMTACKENKESSDLVFVPGQRAKWHRHRLIIANLVAVAAMLMLVLLASIDISRNTRMTKVETIIDIDVNPSIELTVNAEDKVLSAIPINNDAIEILDGMDLRGASTKVAVNAIVGSMFQHGYLKGETNTILVSVESSSPQKSEAMQNEITSDIDNLVKAYSADINVIGQVVDDNAELSEMAVYYGISEGKATLIRKIIEYNDIYKVEELVALNITELNEIICNMENGVSSEVEKPDNTEVENPDSVSGNTVSDNGIVGTGAYNENTVSINEADVTVSGNGVSAPATDNEKKPNDETVSGNNAGTDSQKEG